MMLGIKRRHAPLHCAVGALSLLRCDLSLLHFDLTLLHCDLPLSRCDPLFAALRPPIAALRPSVAPLGHPAAGAEETGEHTVGWAAASR